MDPTEAFFAAAQAGDAAAATHAVGDGADVNAVSERGESAIVEVHTTMLRASRGSRAEWWKVLEAVLQAGARLTETEKHLVAPLEFPVSIWNPDIQSVVANLRSISDHFGREHLAPGTVYFVKYRPVVPGVLSEAARKKTKAARTADYREAVSRLYDSARNSGCTIVAGWNPDWRDTRRAVLQCLHLAPTTDKYAVVALFGLGDWVGGEVPAKTIPKLKELDSQWPFHLRSIGQRHIAVEFLRDLTDAEMLIRTLKSLFPLDFWDTDEEIEASARHYNGQRFLDFRIGIG